MTKPGPNATPAELRTYGDHLTTLPEWGPNPPCWQVAMAQADWYAEARIVEESMHQPLKVKAPFPWFGGKSRAAELIWSRLGDVRSYVEPFAGSLAVLLKRPSPPKIETVNDADGLLCNFWRAVQADPSAVAEAADWPINETDMHARHAWLTAKREDVTAKLEADPEWFDVQVAGWWVWGVSMWIGSGWCVRPEWRGRGIRGVHAKRPAMHNGSNGVHRTDIAAWLIALSQRLRYVRVCCGDWSRVVTPSVTWRISGDRTLCGVLLDPPYAVEAGRRAQLYTHDAPDLSAAVREWALANGDNPALRIAFCGYEGEHAMPDTWECVAWKTTGGYGNQRGDTRARGKANAARERIWFSPHCLQPGLFGQAELMEAPTC